MDGQTDATKCIISPVTQSKKMSHSYHKNRCTGTAWHATIFLTLQAEYYFTVDDATWNSLQKRKAFIIYRNLTVWQIVSQTINNRNVGIQWDVALITCSLILFKRFSHAPSSKWVPLAFLVLKIYVSYYIFIDCEAGEIMHLVASVCLFVCLCVCPSFPVWNGWAFKMVVVSTGCAIAVLFDQTRISMQLAVS